MKELPKAYEPNNYEDNIYKHWEESGFFNPDKCVEKGKTDAEAKHFSIVLPPPNVTGTLHMGHAAMLAIEDLMVRYSRMKGKKTVWVPGTDHAAIATQTKVEKILMEEGLDNPREELGREKFLERVNKFAQESHDTIIHQTKKMGSSLDWSREAFTLDEQRNLAVRTVFKKMYDDGLIYRGHRIVNWCPRCHSTLADDEVEYKEQQTKLYTFKYSKDFPISIATTRPETKLGDTAVAVNPKDSRYKKYIGEVFEIKNFAGGPDLKIKVIGDEEVDSEFGTGALGVTPAHSHVDYEMAGKNDLEIIQVIDEDGKMTAKAGEAYQGLGVEEARRKVVEALKKEGLMEKEEEIANNLSICYRCSHTIEPLTSRQWFIDVNKEFAFKQSKDNPIEGLKDGESVTLKKLMQHVVRAKEIKIVPDRFEKTYFHWIDNLRDWCISRQIWYGHRIPVWYKGDETYVGVDAPEGESWQQDPDTLDTWFSSGLWTFSTLGYPNLDSSDLKTYHPTTVMETGYDILFFWVARMILMTTYTLGEIPFETVYLHGLVRDEQGRKMSKSLGNVIDPLDMIEKYGADATRLSLLVGNTPGNDMKLSEEKIAGFRNFANKLWNISRYIQLTVTSEKKTMNKDLKVPEAETLADKWILNELKKTASFVTNDLESFRFSSAGEQLRDFTWSELADWYLEIAKIEGDKSKVLNYILNTILKLWHPFMPFVTETLWQQIYGKDNILMVESWPTFAEATVGKAAVGGSEDFGLLKNIITNIRSLRADYKIDPAKKLDVVVSAGDEKEILDKNTEVIKGLARLENIEIEVKVDKPDESIGFVVGGVEVYIKLGGVVDFEKEKSRLNNEVSDLGKYINSLEKKLNNENFVDNAPAEVVEKEKGKMEEAKSKLEKLNSQLQSLK
ncbi:MAG: valine--tRNA ligase [Candidatus Magasanikbacteria bacterium]|nr:valine--tRNA ligase [Candidatus Magasanikbacteria bacterium]